MPNYKSYKKAKKRLIKKYVINQLSRENTNNDLFISINDFLAKEQSKGPLADPGEINYRYGGDENIAHFISMLTNELRFEKVICMPQYVLKYGNVIMKNTILYIESNDRIIVPYEFKQSLEYCSYARFIYASLFISEANEMIDNHSNMLIIDLFKKTIERYEPHGKYLWRKGKSKEYSLEVSKKIDIRIKEMLAHLNINLKYLSPIDEGLSVGLQYSADAFEGLCTTHSIMYLHLRIMNPDISQNEIIKYFKQKSKKKLLDMVLRYAKYIEEAMKNKTQKIKNENFYLYNMRWTHTDKFIISDKNGIYEKEY